MKDDEKYPEFFCPPFLPAGHNLKLAYPENLKLVWK